MSLLNTKDIKMIGHMLGKDYAAKWEGFIQKNHTKDVVTIANTGLFSSGKSMLFNALLNRTESERFKVGAIPTTKKGDKERLSDRVEILDTPGINANDTDDNEAFHSLMEADIILMIHNIKTGMLDKYEHDWLRRIAGEMDTGEIQKRMVFVCTWIDESGTGEETEKKVNEIKRQLKGLLSIDIDLWEVSSKRYYTAKEKNKPRLEEASKIPQLREYLLKKAEGYSELAQELRKKELIALCERTKKPLQKEKEGIEWKINGKEGVVCEKYEIKRNIWAGILENFKTYRKAVREILKELEKEEDEEDSYLLKRLGNFFDK